MSAAAASRPAEAVQTATVDLPNTAPIARHWIYKGPPQIKVGVFACLLTQQRVNRPAAAYARLSSAIQQPLDKHHHGLGGHHPAGRNQS
jgi:hypothetical protein